MLVDALWAALDALEARVSFAFDRVTRLLRFVPKRSPGSEGEPSGHPWADSGAPTSCTWSVDGGELAELEAGSLLGSMRPAWLGGGGDSVGRSDGDSASSTWSDGEDD